MDPKSGPSAVHSGGNFRLQKAEEMLLLLLRIGRFNSLTERRICCHIAEGRRERDADDDNVGGADRRDIEKRSRLELLQGVLT